MEKPMPNRIESQVSVAPSTSRALAHERTDPSAEPERFSRPGKFGKTAGYQDLHRKIIVISALRRTMQRRKRGIGSGPRATWSRTPHRSGSGGIFSRFRPAQNSHAKKARQCIVTNSQAISQKDRAQPLTSLHV